MTRRTGPSTATVLEVRARDGFACVRCGVGSPLTTQHRAARGMGGSRNPRRNDPDNLLTLCGSGTTGDHGWVEAHPDEAQRFGWAVPSWADPATVPVLTREGWALLESDGGKSLTDPPPNGDARLLAARMQRA